MNIISRGEVDVSSCLDILEVSVNLSKVNISMTMCVLVFLHRGQHNLIENRCIVVYRLIGNSGHTFYRPLDFNVVEIFLHNA